jgi:hypothetical protein
MKHSIEGTFIGRVPTANLYIGVLHECWYRTAVQARDIQSPFDSFKQTPQAFQQVRRKGMAQDRYVRRAVWN